MASRTTSAPGGPPQTDAPLTAAGNTTTWLTLTVVSPGAALTLFWLALHATSASANHTGSSTAGRIGLVAAILAVPAVAIVFTVRNWSRTSAAGRHTMIAASIAGLAVTGAIGFLEIVVTWLSTMGT